MKKLIAIAMCFMLTGVFCADATLLYDNGTSNSIGGTLTENIVVSNYDESTPTTLDILADATGIAGIDVYGTSIVYLNGAQLHGRMTAYNDSVFVLSGEDFSINGIKVTNGEYNGVGLEYPYFDVSFISSQGIAFSYDFFLNDNSRLVLVPEPATLLMLGIGGLLLRKRLS